VINPLRTLASAAFDILAQFVFPAADACYERACDDSRKVSRAPSGTHPREAGPTEERTVPVSTTSLAEPYRIREQPLPLGSDLHYARDLLAEILEERSRTGRPVDPFPRELSSTLDMALALVQDGPSWSDSAGAAIAEWRNETTIGRVA
jgi:hypothetical protein